MFPRLLSTVLIPLLLVSCGGHIAQIDGVRGQKLRSLGYQPVPMTGPTISDKRPGVGVRINDQPVTLLVDSGANATRISATFAAQAGVNIDPSRRAISRGAMGRSVPVQRGVGSLQVGALSVAPYTFSVIDLGNTRTAAGDFPGHIGAEALRITASVVDIGGNTLWVPTENAPNIQSGEISPLGLQSGLGRVAVPVEPARSYYHIIIEGRVAGSPTAFILDTGAEVSVMTTRAANRLGLPLRATGSTMLDAHGDRTPLSQTIVPEIVFDGFSVQNVPISVAAIPAFDSLSFRTRSGRKIDGILGVDFLRQTNALLDARTRLIYFGKP